MSIFNLQHKIGVNPDGIFGSNTLKSAASHYDLSPNRAIHFFAQTSYESMGFRRFSENLNYSAEALKRVFGKYFPGDLAYEYARKPEKIANRVYANRMGNSDESSGDGWKYRGRGAIQLTGKNNYKEFSKKQNDYDIVQCPDVVEENYAFRSAMHFFDENNLWVICDKGVNDSTIKKLTRRINGGYHGLKGRKNKTYKFSNYFQNL